MVKMREYFIINFLFMSINWIFTASEYTAQFEAEMREEDRRRMLEIREDLGLIK